MIALLIVPGVVCLLLLVNGFLVMSGTAILSVSRARIRELSERGNSRANAVLELMETPGSFVPSIRAVVALVTAGVSVYGGVRVTTALAAALPSAGGWIHSGAAVLTAAGIAFASLVIGEIIPRRLGNSDPERISLATAPLLRWLTRRARPFAAFADRVSEVILRRFRIRGGAVSTATEDDVATMMREGARSGAFHEREPEMVERVLALDRITVRELMTPRTRMIWVNVGDNHTILWHKIVVSGHSRFPVYENTRDNVLGIVSLKAIYANTAAGVPLNIRDLVTKPLFVPETLSASSLLETFQKSGASIALVTDEFGGISGMVSLHDIMEAIVGDLPSMGDRTRPTALRHDNGAWLVDGMLDTGSLEELIPDFGLPEDAGREYQTIAGFVMKQLARMPAEGESFQWGRYEVQVLDLDGFRIDKLLLVPAAGPAESGEPVDAGTPATPLATTTRFHQPNGDVLKKPA